MTVIIILVIILAGALAIDSIRNFYNALIQTRKNPNKKVDYDYSWVLAILLIIYMVVLGRIAGAL